MKLIILAALLSFNAFASGNHGHKHNHKGGEMYHHKDHKHTYKLNTSKSHMNWKGAKVTAAHWGKIKFKSGKLVMKDHKLVGGEFVVDMNSMTNDDIESSEYNKKLIQHLKSDDFFKVSKHPTATLKVKSATMQKGNTYDVVADMTILGNTHPVSFQTVVDHGKSGIMASGKITFDRTKWNIKYGSGKFFKGLGDKMIKDEVSIDFKIASKH